MQKARIYKDERQSIFDLLLQYSGAISGLFEFLNENKLQDIDLSEGEFIAPDLINADVAKSLNPKGLLTPTVITNVVDDYTYIADFVGEYIVDDEDNLIVE